MKSLREYLELELKASSYENPLASDFLFTAADELRKNKEYELAEKAVIHALSALNDEANYCENFSIVPLKEEITDRDIFSYIRRFYKKEGFEFYKDKSKVFEHLDITMRINSYKFRDKDGNELVVATSRNGDFSEEELMVFTKNVKRGMRPAGIEPAS